MARVCEDLSIPMFLKKVFYECKLKSKVKMKRKEGGFEQSLDILALAL